MTNPTNRPLQPAPRPAGGGGKLLLFGGLGCLAILLLGGCLIGGGLLWYSASLAPTARIAHARAPGGGPTYSNDRATLNANLQANYVPFQFTYPADWAIVSRGDAPGESNFVKVEKQDPSKSTVANLAIGWFKGAGTLDRDKTLYASLADQFADSLAPNFPSFTKTGSGPLKVTDNDYDAYQLLFTAKVVDAGETTPILGRVLLISGGNAGQTNGVVLIMLATDKSTMTDPAQLGESGDLAQILDSFTFGK